jgi:hypothetical protein
MILKNVSSKLTYVSPDLALFLRLSSAAAVAGLDLGSVLGEASAVDVEGLGLDGGAEGRPDEGSARWKRLYMKVKGIRRYFRSKLNQLEIPYPRPEVDPPNGSTNNAAEGTSPRSRNVEA